MNIKNIFKYSFFINLKERTDRLEHIKNELPKIGITNAERFNAYKTTNGAVGCTLSHIKCLGIAKERNYPYVFICEDDIQFLNPNVFKESLNKFINSIYMNTFDVLMLAGNNAHPFEKTNDYCVKVYNCRTTTGYLVKNHYYDTLINNFKEGLNGLIKNPTNKQKFAIDMYWNSLQQNDNWYLIIPLTVVQMESYSDIEKRNTNYKSLMTDLEKKWLSQPKFYNMTFVNRK
jgi:GR25 family glycosyltransferase involved in LPS biosynthesis